MQLDGKEKRIFSGWMFADSPGLNAVEHPVFDVWLTDCAQPRASRAKAASPPRPRLARRVHGPHPSSRSPSRSIPISRAGAASRAEPFARWYPLWLKIGSYAAGVCSPPHHAEGVSSTRREGNLSSTLHGWRSSDSGY